MVGRGSRENLRLGGELDSKKLQDRLVGPLSSPSRWESWVIGNVVRECWSNGLRLAFKAGCGDSLNVKTLERQKNEQWNYGRDVGGCEKLVPLSRIALLEPGQRDLNHFKILGSRA